jgi:hypothetical protein
VASRRSPRVLVASYRAEDYSDVDFLPAVTQEGRSGFDERETGQTQREIFRTAVLRSAATKDLNRDATP